MKLRIARKICKYMGYGYPIDNIYRLKKAILVWTKACKRFKHWKRKIKMKRPKHYGKERLTTKNMG